jgi:hypothetical protein
MNGATSPCRLVHDVGPGITCKHADVSIRADSILFKGLLVPLCIAWCFLAVFMLPQGSFTPLLLAVAMSDILPRTLCMLPHDGFTPFLLAVATTAVLPLTLLMLPQDGFTPLHKAADSGHVEVGVLLVAAGAAVGAANKVTCAGDAIPLCPTNAP